MLRSAFVSLFWAIFQFRKDKNGLTLVALAKMINANKSEVSRWFKGDPNWTVNTIAGLAHALDVELEIRARDRTSSIIFTPAGIEKRTHPQAPTTESAHPTFVIPVIEKSPVGVDVRSVA
ncbi:MAG: helix-turn-helix domain-containing protein [Pseudorhodoplanes sp.]